MNILFTRRRNYLSRNLPTKEFYRSLRSAICAQASHRDCHVMRNGRLLYRKVAGNFFVGLALSDQANYLPLAWGEIFHLVDHFHSKHVGQLVLTSLNQVFGRNHNAATQIILRNS